MTERAFPYVYRWNRMDRKGQRCTVLARGTMNSCLVMFDDGFKAVTSRNAIKRFKKAGADGFTLEAAE